MNVKSKVFKRKTGRNKGAWIVRLEYEDEFGRTKYVERHALGKALAADLRNRLVEEIKKSHGQITTGDRMTFADLADYCEKHFYKPAEYVDGRKVSGVRSIGGARSALKSLRNYFGDRPIRSIYRASVRDYKAQRLATPVEVKCKRPQPTTVYRPRKIATVNRELTILRRMLKVALAEGWILRDPFFGAHVISPADEAKRERILSGAEETRLLSACFDEKRTISTARGGKTLKMTVESRRAHLKPLIILALDTGMRRKELFSLRWNDIDFERQLIVVCGTHTKTQRERIVPLTGRAKFALLELFNENRSERVFPFVDVKVAFRAVREEAGLPDVRFHDLRHTAITRMVRGGISAPEAGKIAGHTQPITTYRYINTDLEAVHAAANVLERYSSDILELDNADASLSN
jgi:integrase